MTAETDAVKTATATMMSIFEDWQKAGLGAWAWTNPAWYETALEVNTELARFVSDRIRQDLEFQAELMQCRDAASFREVQGKFLKEAFGQYSAETGKLVRMSQEAMGVAAEEEN
ncbi:phasin family protein [Tropicimonas sp. IMCC6043]|uniref:phasin family protein n=1 Tax=Tropicimonas sp. IMCC6043 TaxID=2510645 RepID=UPI0013EA7260|nr:phasin family protein [Tropicimonas sp. IMCC6043]